MSKTPQHILRIDASMRRENSVSRMLATELADALGARKPSSSIVSRDLALGVGIVNEGAVNQADSSCFGPKGHDNYGWFIFYKRPNGRQVIRQKSHDSELDLVTIRSDENNTNTGFKNGYDDSNIIKLCLDVTNKLFRIAINDKYIDGVPFENIDISNGVYRMAWSMNRDGHTTELKDFQINKK